MLNQSSLQSLHIRDECLLMFVMHSVEIEEFFFLPYIFSDSVVRNDEIVEMAIYEALKLLKIYFTYFFFKFPHCVVQTCTTIIWKKIDPSGSLRRTM